MPKVKHPKKAKPAGADKRAKPVFTEMSTGEATVATLLAHGLNTVYALPGVHNDHLFDAFQRAGEAMRVVHTRHEQGAAYMALGAALATGRPQAYAVVPGPGLLNSGAALLTAYGMNAPVLALIGQIPAANNRPRHRAVARNPRPGRYSLRGWSIITPISAARRKPRPRSPRRSRRCGKTGRGRRRSNARSTSGASARP